MKRYLYLPIIFLFSMLASSCGNEEKRKLEKVQDTTTGQAISKELMKKDGIGGVYSFGEDIEKGAIGSVRVYPLSPDSALFFLNVNRGAPSYNMGLLVGQIKLEDSTWTYLADDGKAPCKLQFSFTGETLDLKVTTPQDNCGFGFGVNVAHSYKRISKDIPTYFLNGEGDTVRFEALKMQSRKL